MIRLLRGKKTSYTFKKHVCRTRSIKKTAITKIRPNKMNGKRFKLKNHDKCFPTMHPLHYAFIYKRFSISATKIALRSSIRILRYLFDAISAKTIDFQLKLRKRGCTRMRKAKGVGSIDATRISGRGTGREWGPRKPAEGQIERENGRRCRRFEVMVVSFSSPCDRRCEVCGEKKTNTKTPHTTTPRQCAVPTEEFDVCGGACAVLFTRMVVRLRLLTRVENFDWAIFSKRNESFCF